MTLPVEQSLVPNLSHGKIHLDLSMWDVLGHFVIWLILSVITLGIGLMFWPYAAAKLVIDHMEVHNASGARLGYLECKTSFGRQIGHIALWTLLVVCTLGLAYPFYLFGVARVALANTIRIHIRSKP